MAPPSPEVVQQLNEFGVLSDERVRMRDPEVPRSHAIAPPFSDEVQCVNDAPEIVAVPAPLKRRRSAPPREDEQWVKAARDEDVPVIVRRSPSPSVASTTAQDVQAMFSKVQQVKRPLAESVTSLLI